MKNCLEKYVTFYFRSIILAQILRIKNAEINYLYVDLSLPEELSNFISRFFVYL